MINYCVILYQKNGNIEIKIFDDSKKTKHRSYGKITENEPLTKAIKYCNDIEARIISYSVKNTLYSCYTNLVDKVAQNDSKLSQLLEEKLLK